MNILFTKQFMNKIAYNIEPAKEEDFPTISVIAKDGKVVYLHSKIYPSKEASVIQNTNPTSITDTLITIGCGLGYHLLPILQNTSVKSLIVIDILEGLDSDIRRYSSIRKYIEKIDTSFVCGKDISDIDSRLTEVLSIKPTNKILIIKHNASVRAFPDYYSKVKEVIEKIIRKQAGNIITKKAFSSLYVRNCIKMLPNLPSFFPFSSLSNKFNDYPCIIVSSAPSIDTYVNFIKQYEDRFFIIAVDSAYSILRSHAIIPDFVLTIDPQPWTEEHLLNIDPEIPLITVFSACNHSLMSKVSFISINTHPFSQIIENSFPDIGSIDSKSGTVAGDALAAAHEMGFSKIFLAGIDFSFPKELIYSKDSKYNQRYTTIFNNRLKTTETLNFTYIRKSLKRLSEEEVRTRQSFLQFRDSFEKYIQQKKMNNVYLLKDKGLLIKNLTVLNNLDEARSLLVCPNTISTKKNIITEIINGSKKNSIFFTTHDIKQIFLNNNLLEVAITESILLDNEMIKLIKYKRLFHSLLADKR
jgi:hypothetical protein